VLYVPDADICFHSAKVATASMNTGRVLRIGTMLEEIILVGAPLKPENMEEYARIRTFDLTPKKVEKLDTSLSKHFHGDVRSGGAAMFLRVRT
jgi:hypothetical protein